MPVLGYMRLIHKLMGMLWPLATRPVTEQMIEFQQAYKEALKHADLANQATYFNLVQNARLVKNAELYYQMLFQGAENTCNIRDQHMFDTLVEIASYLAHQIGRPARCIVWAHKTHIGDGRATAMS